VNWFTMVDRARNEGGRGGSHDGGSVHGDSRGSDDADGGNEDFAMGHDDDACSPLGSSGLGLLRSARPAALARCLCVARGLVPGSVLCKHRRKPLLTRPPQGICT